MMMIIIIKTNNKIERIGALIYTKKTERERTARGLEKQGIHNKRELKKILHTCITKEMEKELI